MFKLIPLFALLFLLNACNAVDKLTSENGRIEVIVKVDDFGSPYYQVYMGQTMVLDTSYLGLTTETADFSRGMTLLNIGKPKKVSDRYHLSHGKQHELSYKALSYKINFANEEGVPFECHFNLSDNGIAYRYFLPSGDTLKILAEQSTFGFAKNTLAWLQPMSKAKSGWKETNPSYEEHYMMEVPFDTPSPIGEGFVYPALFKTDDTWILVSETNVHRNYCGSRLQFDQGTHQMRVTFPQPAEVFPGGALLPNGSAPFYSPWRTLAIGDLGDIVANTLGTDLAAPAIALDTNFIQPGLASWSWILLKDDFITYETSRQFIDYAADMNWPYCLIDVDWDWKIGYDRMQALVDYAAGKNVGIILWYNSSGDWNSTTYTPKSRLVNPDERRAEFDRLRKMGVKGLKVDFFGGDGQSMMAYYHDIMQDAADHNLLLNFHGATLPRGWQRTYPNLMTVEAIKGEEFITFEQSNADLQPSHCAMLPFTRNVYDPMDFTPMVLDSIPGITRRTSTAFELALPILFTSGIQHIAEKPEGMAKMPSYVKDLLRNIPSRWDEVRLLSGYPGKEVVIARRSGEKWFVAGINGEALQKTFSLDLSFVDQKSGILYTDGKESGAPIGQKEIKSGFNELKIGAFEGFVITF